MAGAVVSVFGRNWPILCYFSTISLGRFSNLFHCWVSLCVSYCWCLFNLTESFCFNFFNSNSQFVLKNAKKLHLDVLCRKCQIRTNGLKITHRLVVYSLLMVFLKCQLFKDITLLFDWWQFMRLIKLINGFLALFLANRVGFIVFPIFIVTVFLHFLHITVVCTSDLL